MQIVGRTTFPFGLLLDCGDIKVALVFLLVAHISHLAHVRESPVQRPFPSCAFFLSKFSSCFLANFHPLAASDQMSAPLVFCLLFLFLFGPYVGLFFLLLIYL
jgi:hypothetical protein